MKLLIILSIEEHTQEVRKLLREEGVPMYSETEIYGFNTEEHKPDLSNWFAQNQDERFSKMFFTFQEEQAVSRVLDAVKQYNREHSETRYSPIHAYQLNVEASA
ncbi:MAG: hypothetical protein FH748_03370 [Balneolaceae bacterium]|nr:hypothetical protein [Balneolaceae bacterium]